MYLDTIRERLRCHEVGGGGEQNSKNGWVTNNGGVVNEWGVDRSVNYYMYVCVCTCVCVRVLCMYVCMCVWIY